MCVYGTEAAAAVHRKLVARHFLDICVLHTQQSQRHECTDSLFVRPTLTAHWPWSAGGGETMAAAAAACLILPVGGQHTCPGVVSTALNGRKESLALRANRRPYAATEGAFACKATKGPQPVADTTDTHTQAAHVSGCTPPPLPHPTLLPPHYHHHTHRACSSMSPCFISLPFPFPPYSHLLTHTGNLPLYTLAYNPPPPNRPGLFVTRWTGP